MTRIATTPHAYRRVQAAQQKSERIEFRDFSTWVGNAPAGRERPDASKDAGVPSVPKPLRNLLNPWRFGDARSGG